jgi:branched-chain amino acid aminotransferase
MQLPQDLADSIININGVVNKAQDAKISVFDRGFLYGDSIYEVFPIFAGQPLFYDEHIERLWNSASLIHMPIQFTKEHLNREIERTLKESSFDRTYIRIILTRGISSIGLNASGIEHNLIIISKPLPLNPRAWYEQGVSVHIASVIRNDPRATNPNAKSGNYLNNVLAHLEAKKLGFFDAVMANKQGNITEGTTNNIWMIKDKVIKTPPVEAGLLRGITRDKIISLLDDYQFEEVNFSIDEFKNCDEAFLTSSTKGIVPITKIDDRSLKKGELTTQLCEKFLQHVRSELKLPSFNFYE